MTTHNDELRISWRGSGAVTSPALVLLHAFPVSSAMWQAQLAHFGKRFRVLAPDARGFGETSPFTQLPSVEQIARDLAAFLDCLEIERAIIGGCSMGGYVALEFARQFPARLRALILCDTRADADSPEAKVARDEMIAFAEQHDGVTVAERMLPKLLCDQTRTDKPEVVEQVRALANGLSGENAAQMIRALRDRRDSTSVLGSIGVPTLVIGGEEDAVSPPDVMARMAGQIENAKHVVITNAGHLSSLEQPREWNREVKRWLEEEGL
jgi:3-oxoadipate enol-lactonase